MIGKTHRKNSFVYPNITHRSRTEKSCVTTQVMSVKLYLDPAFYYSVFPKFLFLTIANELYCVTSSDWLSLDHAVKNLALTQRGFT